MDIIQNIAAKLDIPGFPWKKIVLGIGAIQFVWENYLAYRQYRLLHAPRPPKLLQPYVEQETFEKSQDYARDKARFGFLSGAYDFIISNSLVVFNAYPFFWKWASRIVASYIAPLGWGLAGEITKSIVFLELMMLTSTLTSLPVSLYSAFVIEERHGFNKQTLKTFFTDILKSQALGLVFMVPLIGAFVKIIHYFGDSFFFYLWLLSVGVVLLMQVLMPTVITPLFNKFTPLQDGELRDSINALAAKFNFPLKKLYVIDGSRRSNHSNAYFMGLPWSKQIVIYDTLIEQASTQEITAIAAHELGHWYLNHIFKMVVIAESNMFATFVGFSCFYRNRSLFESFGFHLAAGQPVPPVVISFALFSALSEPIDSIVQFGFKYLSRKFEYEADDFGRKAGYKQELGKALIGLNAKNLSATDTDWLYSAYHHTHPTLLERLKALDYTPEEEKKQQ